MASGGGPAFNVNSLPKALQTQLLTAPNGLVNASMTNSSGYTYHQAVSQQARTTMANQIIGIGSKQTNGAPNPYSPDLINLAHNFLNGKHTPIATVTPPAPVQPPQSSDPIASYAPAPEARAEAPAIAPMDPGTVDAQPQLQAAQVADTAIDTTAAVTGDTQNARRRQATSRSLNMLGGANTSSTIGTKTLLGE